MKNAKGFSIKGFALAIVVTTLAHAGLSSAATDQVKARNPFGISQDGPKSRVKDREHPTKERRAKVRETAPEAEQKGSMPKDKTGCIVVTEIVELPDGRTVVRDSWRCERDIKRGDK